MMLYQYSEKEQKKLQNAQDNRKVFERYGISFCTREDPDYPKDMKALSGMPPLLYYKGDISIINQSKNLAAIGTRKPSKAGAELSYQTGKTVGKAGVNLVNGLALGCDTEAIKGALSVGGKCIAVMPCGLDEIVPRTNRQIADEILKAGGCLISEYPVGTRLQKYNYVQRDRLQSGISQAVVVIEADRESGTMHTAEYARKQFKRLACYYYRLTEIYSGNQYLEESGKAQVLKGRDDLEKLIKKILSDQEYEQLSFL